MATAIYTTQRAETRILDGTATPRFLVLPWVQPDGRFPLARARPPYMGRLNRGVGDGYAHFTRGPDDAVIAPVVVTMTAWLDEQLADDVIAALSNPFRLATWSVGTSTFVTAAGTGASILNGANANFAVPQVADDAAHQRVHVEWLFKGKVAGTLDRGFRHEECWFPPELQVYGEGDPNTLSLTYWCFGKLTTITAFTAGTDITPALT